MHQKKQGIGVVHKILDVADQAANALENVPVLNEAVGIARPLYIILYKKNNNCI